jgi:hypothetical protein
VVDANSTVLDRYDIPTEGGITQVILSPEVKAVLNEIKKMPGRMVAGSRAQAFLINPFAALGDDASNVIEEGQFQKGFFLMLTTFYLCTVPAKMFIHQIQKRRNNPNTYS